jgi:hypothetical protein
MQKHTRTLATRHQTYYLLACYVGKEHADHLIKCLQEKYKLTKDWAGESYCGISLMWNYGA